MSDSNGKLPPFSEEDERCVLSCVLQTGDRKLLEKLRLDHFYDLRHQTIYEALAALRAAGEDLTQVPVERHLSRHQLWVRAGTREFLTKLVDAAHSPANFAYWLDGVENLAIRRAAIRDAQEIALLADDPKVDVSALRSAATRLTTAYSHPPGTNGTLPEMVKATDFLAHDLPESPQVIDGILHQGSKLAFGGGSKTFKTWQLLDVAVSVATGMPWLRFNTRRGRVLYVNFEIQEQPMQKRLQTLLKNKGDGVNLNNLTLWNLRGKSSKHEVIIPKIRQATVGKGFSLIILDPVYKMYGETDENSAGDIALLMNSIEDLSVTTGAAVAFGIHYSKGNQSSKEAIDRVSGSGVFARDPDSLLMLTKHQEDDAFTFEAILRNFPPVPPFVVRWEFPLMKLADDLDPQDLKVVGGRPKTYYCTSIINFLDEKSLSSSEWCKICYDELGMSRRQFYNMVKEAEEQGLIIKSKINQKWCKVQKVQ